MKQSITKIVKAAVAITMAIGMGISAGVSIPKANPVCATEVAAYTLSGATTGSGSGYNGNNTVTQSAVSWKVNGNLTQNPWRIGGNNSNGLAEAGTVRIVQSQAAVSSSNITKVVVTTAKPASNAINPTNVSLKVGTSIGGSQTSTLSNGSWAASVTFNRPNDADWSNKHFEIGFTMPQNSTGTNKYITFTSAIFYYEVSQNTNYYDVTFNPLNGEESDVRNVVEDATINPLPAPTKSKDTINQIRYEFAGWYTVDDPSNPVFEEGNKFTESTQVKSNLNLYAKYNAIDYHIVSFETNGGSPVDSIEVDHGKTFSKPNNPSKRCYNFVGWYTTPGCTDGSEFTFASDTINVNTTLYAKWANSVTPISENGVFVKVVDNEGLINGAKYLITYNGEKAFDGALENLDVSSNNIDVEFDGSYIVKDNNTSTAYFTIDTTNGYILSASGKYIGIGSYKNGMLVGTEPDSSFQNNFAFDGGNFVVGRQINEEGTMYLKYNSDSGQYRFRYFKTGQQNIQLYRFAQAYTVSFVTNGGSAIADKSVPDGCTLTLPDNPTKSPDATYTYTFEGWYTNEELTSAFNSLTPITGNLTLYAKYTRELIDNPADYLSQGETVATLSAVETNATEETKTVTFSNGYHNGENITDNPVAIGRVTLTGAKATGSNVPAYYSSDSTLRAYTSNTLTFSSPYTISRIVITFLNSSNAKDYNVSSGTFEIDEATGTWEGSATSVVLTATANNRMSSISVTYSGDITNVGSVALRFGVTIPKDRWNSVASNWTISDYGVMIVKKYTLETTYSLGSVEAAHEASQPLAVLHSGNGDTPYEQGDNYLFTVRLNMSNSISYRIVYRAAPFVVVNGTYYFLDEIECSVNSLAADYITSGTSGMSNTLLNILAGN